MVFLFQTQIPGKGKQKEIPNILQLSPGQEVVVPISALLEILSQMKQANGFKDNPSLMEEALGIYGAYRDRPKEIEVHLINRGKWKHQTRFLW